MDVQTLIGCVIANSNDQPCEVKKITPEDKERLNAWYDFMKLPRKGNILLGWTRFTGRNLRGKRRAFLIAHIITQFPGQCPDRRSDFESVEGGFGL
jgi:hypothetical protein